jgi:hypothetical protein
MEFYQVTVDFMTTSYALNIKLSDKFNTLFSRLAIFSEIQRKYIIIALHFRHDNTD